MLSIIYVKVNSLYSCSGVSKRAYLNRNVEACYKCQLLYL
nr:MAG TPA: hypothetical protein [Crassvirales sp.]